MLFLCNSDYLRFRRINKMQLLYWTLTIYYYCLLLQCLCVALIYGQFCDLFAGDVFVFQQDTGSGHRAHDTVKLLRLQTPQLIHRVLTLNRQITVSEECVYRLPIRDTDELRQRVVVTWAEFQQSVADDATDQWRKRLHHVSMEKVFTLNIAVMLLAWNFSCHTLQQVLFRATDIWRNATYLQSDEKGYHFTRLMRFLKARNWNVDEAEKQLKETVDWRRQVDPLNVDCRWCHERPGYHCIRQIGFDKQQRPVLYACFAQAVCAETTVDDSIVHMTHLLENAKKTMSGDVSTWVFIVDCTGMTLLACNPRVGYGIANAIATYYPERLGLAILIHHSPLFQGVWNAIKVFLDPNTAAKMQMLRKKSKFREAFFRMFDEELATWLMDEVKLNKQRPMPSSQRQFWNGVDISATATPPAAPSPKISLPLKLPKSSKETNKTNTIATLIRRHDPRGCPSYVRQYIEPYLDNIANASASYQMTLHHPHPNIVDQLRGTIASDALPAAAAAADAVVTDGNSDEMDGAAATPADLNSDDDDDDDQLVSLTSLRDIDDQFQIPKHIYEQRELKRN